MLDPRIQPFCEAYIKRHEGLRLKPYWDVDGYSIGYGHHYMPSQEVPDLITVDQAERLFLADFNCVCASVNKVITWVGQLDPARQSAIVDMTYNMGIARMMQFGETLAHIQAEEWQDVARHIKASKYYTQVTMRAEENINLFLYGREASPYVIPEIGLLPPVAVPEEVPVTPPAEPVSFWTRLWLIVKRIFGG